LPLLYSTSSAFENEASVPTRLPSCACLGICVRGAGSSRRNMPKSPLFFCSLVGGRTPGLGGTERGAAGGNASGIAPLSGAGASRGGGDGVQAVSGACAGSAGAFGAHAFDGGSVVAAVGAIHDSAGCPGADDSTGGVQSTSGLGSAGAGSARVVSAAGCRSWVKGASSAACGGDHPDSTGTVSSCACAAGWGIGSAAAAGSGSGVGAALG